MDSLSSTSSCSKSLKSGSWSAAFERVFERGDAVGLGPFSNVVARMEATRDNGSLTGEAFELKSESSLEALPSGIGEALF